MELVITRGGEVMHRYKIHDGKDYSYVVTVGGLIAILVVPTLDLQNDTEDHIRKWIVSEPKIGDVLQESGHDLPIERIA